MLQTSLSRSENFIRADLPNAVAVVRNFQLQSDRISFELQFFADKSAKEMIDQPLTEMPVVLVESGGVVSRKHFNEQVSVIESYQPDESATTLTGKLISCCYKWLLDKHYPAATEI
jgi:hypothetical protein